MIEEFPKIARLCRDVVITEKLDGVNAQIRFTESGTMLVGSRSRWITPDDDNYGFAAWAYANMEELRQLGPGLHFGEWWGNGIYRGYGVDKQFSLFNVKRWRDASVRPHCCGVVPVLYSGVFSISVIDCVLQELIVKGSVAAPGFMRPEGVVVYHTAANVLFKKTIGNDKDCV